MSKSDIILQKPTIELLITEEDNEIGIVRSTNECAISLCLSRLGYSQVEVMQDRLYIGNITYWFDQISKEYMKDYDAGIDISGHVLKAYIISPKEVEQAEVKVKRKYTKKIKEAHSENINIVRI